MQNLDYYVHCFSLFTIYYANGTAYSDRSDSHKLVDDFILLL